MSATITADAPAPAQPRGEAWRHVVGYRVMARVSDLAYALVAGGAVIVVTSITQYFGLLSGWAWLEDWSSWSRTPLAIAAAIAAYLYTSVHLVATRGASIGKRQFGLIVNGPTTSIGIGYGRALLREVVSVLGLTSILAVSNATRRGPADLVAGTAVWSRDASTPPGVLRDVRVYQVVGQIVAVAIVLGGLRWAFGNLFDNLDRANISTDFGFLNGPTNFTVSYDDGFDARSPVRSMVWIGVKNTLLSAIVGIGIALVLGTLIGIARLSTNWLVAKISMLYVEILRNIPPLVIIIFFASAIFTNGSLPVLSGTSEPISFSVPGSDSTWLLLSKSVWGIPSFASDGNVGLFWLLAAVAAVITALVWRWRTRVNVATGAAHHRVMWSLAVFLGITAIAWIALAAPYRWSFPSVSENGRRIENGFITNFAYISVTIALGLYTASHVAEIVRGSILAVARGQTEAANALALNGFQRYRFVVLPQATRIAVPPLINQCLNLTKNTSLGIAVAYAELTALTQSSIGNGRPAVQSLVILISLYLLFSVVISVVLNEVNRRFQLEEG